MININIERLLNIRLSLKNDITFRSPYETKTEQSSIEFSNTHILFTETCDVLNNCHKDASCDYSELTHSYSCVCKEGFEGNGYACEVEVLSCTQVDNCDPHATCTYNETLGKSKCVCNLGYDGDGYSCIITGKIYP